MCGEELNCQGNAFPVQIPGRSHFGWVEDHVISSGRERVVD